MSFVVHPVL
jgi:hypothetical protein